LGQDYQHHGLLGIELLRDTLGTTNYEFFLCGPLPMMRNLLPALETWGVPEEDVSYEAFSPASIKPVPSGAGAADNRGGDSAEASFDITLTKSGCSFAWRPSDGSILDTVESHGVTIDAGCRAGNCGTCVTAVQSGSVGYSKPPGIDVENGSCLVCVAQPKTDLVLDA
jgi:ferredoxin